MISKNYVTMENMPGNNNYSLKLTSNINSAFRFKLVRIHETRSSQEFLTFKQSFCISILIKEKEQYYYVNSKTYFIYKSTKYDVDSNINLNSYNSNMNIITNEHIKENNNRSINNIIEKDDDPENNYSDFYENYSELSIDKKMNTKY